MSSPELNLFYARKHTSSSNINSRQDKFLIKPSGPANRINCLLMREKIQSKTSKTLSPITRLHFERKDSVGEYANMHGHIAEYNNLAANKALINRKAGHEDMKRFVAKKRKILLLQLNIDSKSEQITKLGDQIKEKRDKLREVEEKIKGDVHAFTSFIDHTRLESRDTIKCAETVTRGKLELGTKLRKMNEEKMSKQIANQGSREKTR